MITTVIPFLLLAKLPPNVNYHNGPEYTFISKVEVTAEQKSVINGLNITNSLKCRPKEETVLSCQFRHDEFVTYDFNKDTQEMTKMNMPHSHPAHGVVPFEIKFNENGVENIVIAEDTKYDFRILLRRTIANLLNVGLDLSKVNFNNDGSSEPITMKKAINFMLGICNTKVATGVTSESADDDDRVKGVEQLQLAPHLTQLNGRNLYLVKSYNTSDCIYHTKFFWAGILQSDIHDDPNLKINGFSDVMLVSENEFQTGTDLVMEREYNGEHSKIRELVDNKLSEISPASGPIPAIENPVTISADDVAKIFEGGSEHGPKHGPGHGHGHGHGHNHHVHENHM